MRVSAGLPTGMEGLTYPIPFSDPENVIRIAQAAEKFDWDRPTARRSTAPSSRPARCGRCRPAPGSGWATSSFSVGYG
jgi:hypothetical protein